MPMNRLRTHKAILARYIYSACIVTTTPDVRILHDPWFTEGAYDGSWFQYPKISDPIKSIGEVDLIYVSHVHPDHYDSIFLKKYFAEYGVKEVIVADHATNHLVNKMHADGIAATILRERRQIRNTTIEIVPHKTNSISDIDSAIIVKYFDGNREHCVVNTNDIIFDDAMVDALRRAVNEPDILFCGYTGAGPYPQTYFDFEDPRLLEEAEKKRLVFFDRYLRLSRAMNAKVNIPFAGKYILGGKLAKLNAYRGVADAIEVMTIDPKALVLADGGGEINTSDLKPTAVRTERYSLADIQRREDEICAHKMDYERLIDAQEIHQLPIKRLLVAAARRASGKSECETDYFFVISLPNNELAIINANKMPERLIKFMKNTSELPEPRSEIHIDPRYLFGLLANVYHWNNAEVGSQYNTRRTPNELNRAAQSFLNYLST